MDPNKDKDFIPILKETRELLQTKYDKKSELTPTNHASFELFNHLLKYLDKYYQTLALFLMKKRKTKENFLKVARENNYFLFDDFVIDNSFMKYQDEALDAIIYSPLSVNYFVLSFKNILHEYFKDKRIPDNFQIQSEIISSILVELNKNMKFCPLYLKQILINGFNYKFKKKSPETIFHNNIIDAIFEHPHLFSILEYSEKVKADENELKRLKTVIHEYLKVDKTFFTGDEHLTVLHSSLRPKEQSNENALIEIPLNNFKNLLINSKKAIDQISSEFYEYNLSDQIKYLLIDENAPNYEKQKECFDSLQNQFKLGRKFVKTLRKSFDHIQFQIEFIELQKPIKQIISFMNMYSESYTEDKYLLYIDDPHVFLNDLTIKNDSILTDSNDSQDAESFLYVSSLPASRKDPKTLSSMMLSGCTLSEFIKHRPELKMADEFFQMRMQGCTKFTYTPLVDFSREKAMKFGEIAKKFYDAFATDKGPYTMMSKLSHLYQEVRGSLKMKINADDEKNFICTLFNLVQPKNVFSTFVYLFDFLLAPNYNDVYFGKKSDHFNRAEKVIKTYVLSLFSDDRDMFYVAEFLRIRNYQVDLVLKKDVEVLHNLAQIIALDDDEKETYLNVFDGYYQKPIVENHPQFTFRLYRKNENDEFPEIFVCNVLDLVDDGYDMIPLNDSSSLAKFLKEKYNSQFFLK